MQRASILIGLLDTAGLGTTADIKLGKTWLNKTVAQGTKKHRLRMPRTRCPLDDWRPCASTTWCLL